jgi:hypothetical protein
MISCWAQKTIAGGPRVLIHASVAASFFAPWRNRAPATRINDRRYRFAYVPASPPPAPPAPAPPPAPPPLELEDEEDDEEELDADDDELEAAEDELDEPLPPHASTILQSAHEQPSRYKTHEPLSMQLFVQRSVFVQSEQTQSSLSSHMPFESSQPTLDGGHCATLK